MDTKPGSRSQRLTNRQDTWSARCGENRTAGAAGGPGKPTGSNPGKAPRSDPAIPCSPAQLIIGRAVQGTRRGTPEMHERGKSDRPVVPANLLNKAAAAEVGEERGRAKGNTAGKTHPGHSAGQGASSALGRVREVARRDKDARFTALLHHVGVSRLRAA